MTKMVLELPPELSVALGKRPAEVVDDVRLMAALKMFESGRISSGLAADVAGIPRASFLLLCGQHGVSVFQQTAEEALSDAATIQTMRRR